MAFKPSRSDEVLDADQQVKITNQVKAHFDSLAPKRPTKPSRSEPDIDAEAAANPDVDHRIPELEKLRSLQSDLHVKISLDGNNTTDDEFVETRYYKELESVEKQHHTTGNGFIRISGGDNENGYHIRPETGNGAEDYGYVRNNFKSNPATNDWVPGVEENQVFVSSKPNRSEG